MGLDPATLALASLALGAVGTGVQFYGQQQAAASQQQFALLNAQAQAESASMQSRLAMANAQMQQTQANLEKAAQEINAQALRGEADAKTRAASENARREREAQREMQAQLRARQSASGLVDSTGSPLALLEKAAEEQQLSIAEGMYQNELERRTLFQEATNTDRGAAFAGIQGNLRYLDGLNQAAAFRQEGIQGRINALGSVAQSQAGQAGALGGLIGNVSGLASSGYNFYRQGAFRGFGFGAKPIA